MIHIASAINDFGVCMCVDVLLGVCVCLSVLFDGFLFVGCFFCVFFCFVFFANDLRDFEAA